MSTCWLLNKSKCNKGNLYSQNVDFLPLCCQHFDVIYLLYINTVYTIHRYIMWQEGVITNLFHLSCVNSHKFIQFYSFSFIFSPFMSSLQCRWLVLYGYITWQKLLNFWTLYFLFYAKNNHKLAFFTSIIIHWCQFVRSLELNILQVIWWNLFNLITYSTPVNLMWTTWKNIFEIQMISYLEFKFKSSNIELCVIIKIFLKFFARISKMMLINSIANLFW